MLKKTFLWLCILILADSFKLNRQRPSTAWGVQKHVFKSEKEYFKPSDGTYHFGYDTGIGQHQMFRNERRYSDASVVGFYGYVDPKGVLRITEYIAGKFGFQQRTVLRYPVPHDFDQNIDF